MGFAWWGPSFRGNAFLSAELILACFLAGSRLGASHDIGGTMRALAAVFVLLLVSACQAPPPAEMTYTERAQVADEVIEWAEGSDWSSRPSSPPSERSTAPRKHGAPSRSR